MSETIDPGAYADALPDTPSIPIKTSDTPTDLPNGVQVTTFDWTEAFTLTDEEAEKLTHPDWIIPNLVIQGHVIVFPGAPGAGKTTIFLHISGEMAAKDYQVFYVNADTGGGDAKAMLQLSKEKGFTLLLPDMKAGKSMEDITTMLASMNDTGGDFNRVVFIFDTLKKMTEVINKNTAKKLYKLLRSLSAKGMTIILLAHTNKYEDAEGRPIFEGTGDLRADVDEMIYLIPEKNEDGSMIVTTDLEKVRGSFKPISFRINSDRTVTQLDQVVNTKAANVLHKKIERDEYNIEAIDLAIEAGHTSQKEIIEYCDDMGIGSRIVKRVLKAYSRDFTAISALVGEPPRHDGFYWIRERGEKKTIVYKKAVSKCTF